MQSHKSVGMLVSEMLDLTTLAPGQTAVIVTKHVVYYVTILSATHDINGYMIENISVMTEPQQTINGGPQMYCIQSVIIVGMTLFIGSRHRILPEAEIISFHVL